MNRGTDITKSTGGFSANPSKIADWQRRFYAAPAVWVVTGPDGCITNAYDSEAAARVELAWHERLGKRGYMIRSEHIHSLELAIERWGTP